MSHPIYVDAYSGFRANERPVRFVLDGETYDVETVEDRWYEPEAEFFKVLTAAGKRCLLRYAEGVDSWTLLSAFDGDELLSRPGLEIVTVGPEIVRAAERRIEACENCHPDDAEIPFDWVLSDVTGRTGMADFVLSETARCPVCKHEISEKSLVDRR